MMPFHDILRGYDALHGFGTFLCSVNTFLRNTEQTFAHIVYSYDTTKKDFCQEITKKSLEIYILNKNCTPVRRYHSISYHLTGVPFTFSVLFC